MNTLFHTLHRRLPLLLAALLLLCALPDAQADRIKRRGRFLRSEIQHVDERTSYTVTLHIMKDTSFPAFQFNRMLIRSIKEINIYETVLDDINGNDDEAQNVRAYRNVQVIPGEFIRANPSSREETVPDGPFANATFTVNGQQLFTDAKGVATDSRQLLLSIFDDLTVNSATVTCEHPAYGKQQLTVTRMILKSPEDVIPEYRQKDQLATLDVLESMGLDYAQGGQTRITPLEITCDCPKAISGGELIPLTITVTNHGQTDSCNLLVGLFSRAAWLDGKLFYFGCLKPGEKRSFLRLIQAPAELPQDITYAVASPWDNAKARPEQALQFSLTRKN